MSVALKQGDIYRGAWGFRNTPYAVRRFPLPFPEDRYMYSVNIEPHVPGPKGSAIEFPIDCDEHYVEECHERANVLDEDPLRYQALPHMLSAQWDTLELGMQSLSQSYPQDFTLTRQGRHWHWINRPLGRDQHLVEVGLEGEARCGPDRHHGVVEGGSVTSGRSCQRSCATAITALAGLFGAMRQNSSRR